MDLGEDLWEMTRFVVRSSGSHSVNSRVRDLEWLTEDVRTIRVGVLSCT